MEQESKNLPKPAVILLDVYETLLDMSDVEKRVNNLMDSKRGYTLWFELFMQYCFVDNCTGQFNSFSSIASATMQMAGKMLGEKIPEGEINSILEMLRHLPVQDGVPEGLSLLNDKGFRIAALTNSPEQTVMDRMEMSGLVSFFEVVLSAERIKKYKPCCEVYEWAAEKLKVQPRDILLISAHSWDVAGAANAGMQTAFIERSNQMLYPLAPPPFMVAKNLDNMAQLIQSAYNA